MSLFSPFSRVSRWAAVVLMSVVSPLLAQEAWPAKPIQLVIPFPPGGGADMSARLVAERLSDELGVRVLVDNRPGAEANIAMRHVSQSRADGYTLLFAIPSVIQNPMLQTLDYDPQQSLQPLVKLTEASLVLLVRPGLKVGSWEELLKLGRAASTPLNCAASGANPLIGCELLKRQGRVALNVIPYKGNGPAMNDLLGGHVDMLFDLPNAAKAQAENKTVLALATTGSSRADAPFQDLPLTRSLVPGFVINTWQGIMSPAGLPDDIRSRLETALGNVMNDPQVQSKLKANGLRPAFETTRQFTRTLNNDTKHYLSIFQEVGMVRR
jgi:tripartite-type tricarboxylate transporter receptor subunit TctC